MIPLLLAARRTGLDVRLSRNAGRYLCNHLYRRALESSAAERTGIAVFVHVPKVARSAMARPRSARRPAMTASDLMRVGRALLPILISAARKH
jgi:pyroglutamyl-peptidase